MDKDKDQELFSQISIDIREHPNNYRITGEWLDKYCSEDNYWKRKEAELKEDVEKYKGKVNPIWQKDIAKLRNDIERHESTLFARFNTAHGYLLKKYKEQDFITEDDARCFILITWLLTDANAEKANLDITQFEKWSWEPADELFSYSRGAASSLWHQNPDAYNPWMRLVHFAWKAVESNQSSLEKPAETEQKARSLFKKIIGWISKKTSHFICAIVVAVIATIIAAIIVDILADFGWIQQIKAFIYQIVGK